MTSIPLDAETAAIIVTKMRNICFKRFGQRQRQHACSFENEWKQLVSTCAGLGATILDESAALPIFLQVMENVYTNEEEFDKALFSAFFQALGAENSLVYVDNDKNEFKLKEHPIGFGRQICRKTRTGLYNSYRTFCRHGLLDHVCMAYHQQSHQPPPGVAVERYDDITACVAIKHSATNCYPFQCFRISGTLREPDLEDRHSALAQAILYNMDIWHCLARRGVVVDAIPFTILSGRFTDTSNDPSEVALCCVEAAINILDCKLGNWDFSYSVNNSLEYKSENDKNAIAIYVKTMRTGLMRAMDIKQNYSNRVGPASLFCRRLTIRDTILPDAELVGCPIPGAVFIDRPISDDSPTSHYVSFNISQGELFKCGPYKLKRTGPKLGICGQPIEENHAELVLNATFESDWVCAFGEDDIAWFGSCAGSQDPVLVKVSHATVHNSLVPQTDCLLALQRLHTNAERCSRVKSAIANVLLGFARRPCGSLITFMTDLSTHGYGPLDHSEFFRGRRMNVLWDGFVTLVKNVLLPMAEAGVNHVDIRVRGNMTYNILSKDSRNGRSGGRVDLVLIDYESLVLESKRINVKATVAMQSIPPPQNAHKLLWWQVLWLANCWIAQVPATDKLVVPEPEEFVYAVFSRPCPFHEFRCLLGHFRFNELKRMSQVPLDKRSIERTLKIKSRAFSSYKYPAPC